jgi:hypothetical protein
MRSLMLAATLLIGLAACEKPKDAAPQAVAATSGTADPGATAAAPAASSTAKAALVNLEGEGLRLVDPDNGHASPLPFGSPKAQTLAALGKAMGGAPDKQETNDCGPGQLLSASWNKGLTVLFQDDKFVGWSGAVDLKTGDGIGFGSTRAQLKAAYPDAKISQTSLGTEFSAGGLSGVLESEGPDAAISDIWAGMTCVAR